MKRKIDDRKFLQIKHLLDDIELSRSQASKLMGVSRATISRIGSAGSYKEYKDNMSENNTHRPDKKDYNQSLTTPIHDVLVEIRDEMKTLNEYIRKSGKSKSFRLF